jgi:hypothetical protein
VDRDEFRLPGGLHRQGDRRPTAVGRIGAQTTNSCTQPFIVSFDDASLFPLFGLPAALEEQR